MCLHSFFNATFWLQDCFNSVLAEMEKSCVNALYHLQYLTQKTRRIRINSAKDFNLTDFLISSSVYMMKSFLLEVSKNVIERSEK